MRIQHPTRATGHTINDSATARSEDGTFAAWLMRIATNTVNDLLRYQRRQPTIRLNEWTDDSGADLSVLKESAGVENGGLRQEDMCLLTLIDQLPTCQREALLIVDVHGYTYAEAMHLLALPLCTIKSHLCQARIALRDQLVETGQLPGWSG